MNKRLVVIGGTGFFGQCFSLFANKNRIDGLGFDEIVYLGRSQPSWSNSIRYPQSFFISDNFNKFIFSEGDTVIHCAMPTNEQVYFEWQNCASFINDFDTFLFTTNLSEIKNEINFCYVSSGAVYGTPAYGEKPDEYSPLSDSHRTTNKSNYAKIKIVIEELVLKFFEGKASIARPFAFFDFISPTNKHFALPSIIQSALNGDFEIKSPNTFRSFLDAKSLVDDLIFISTQKGEIFNVGSENALSMAEIGNIVSKISKTAVKFGNDYRYDYYVPNVTKIRGSIESSETKIHDRIINFIKHNNL